MVITLIGYRGTGKSTVAAPLAESLGWDWVDADAQIERQAGKSIREVFAEDGEDAFRRLERDVMRELLARDRGVIAAGGGAVGNADTRNDLKAAGPVVWLTATVETITRRLGGDRTTAARRPDLTLNGGREEIVQILAQREPLYRECADIVVETDNTSAEQIVQTILQAVAPRLEEGAAG